MNMSLSETDISSLEDFAKKIRCGVVRMLAHAGSGHLAGALGMADIYAVLYGHSMCHFPRDPLHKERDRLVLSNGHTSPVRYVAMALSGYFPEEELLGFRSFGSRLQGHPEVTRLVSLETTSGPLGDGLGQAVGMAISARLRGETHRVFCITSDAEQQCGVTWEAMLLASAQKLSNLTVIIDRNGIQIGGATEEVLPIHPLREKYEAFGFKVIEIDGHAIDMIQEALSLKEGEVKPCAIIAHTIAGKGIPDIEGDYRWHGRVPTLAESVRFLKALNTVA
jgi:transketolase